MRNAPIFLLVPLELGMDFLHLILSCLAFSSSEAIKKSAKVFSAPKDLNLIVYRTLTATNQPTNAIIPNRRLLLKGNEMLNVRERFCQFEASL